MASICGQTANINTGLIDCDPERERVTNLTMGSAIFLPGDYGDADTFNDVFYAKTLLPKNDPQKLLPMPPVQGFTNNTVAPTDGTLGYGLVIRLQDGRPTYEFDIKVGTTFEKKMKQYDGKQARFFLGDKTGQWGIVDRNGAFSAPLWQVALTPRPHQGTDNPTVTKLSLSLVNTDDFVINAAVVPYQVDTASLKGLNDVVLEKVSNSANVYTYSAYIPTAVAGKVVTLASLAGSAAAVASLWPARTGVSFGTPLTITSVALSGDNYIVTYDSTAYSALATGAKIQQRLADPVTLDAANVTGVEGVPVIVTK